MNDEKKYISITTEYCVTIRVESIKRIGLSEFEVSSLLEFKEPLDKNNDLISFGPSFGIESSDEFIKRLKSIGLYYIDDFFVFYGDFPDWADFKIGIKRFD